MHSILKKMKFFLLVVILIISSNASVQGQLITQGIYRYTIDDARKEATVSELVNPTLSEYTIPEKVIYNNIEYIVTEMSESLFRDQTHIISVIFPKSMTGVSMPGCSGLKSITLPEGIKGVDLSGCTGLTSVTFPDGVTGLYLSGCTGLSSFNFPSSVINLDLSDCTQLTTLTVPTNVISLHCTNCTNLTSVTLTNKKLESIGTNAFANCINLASINIPETVTGIGGGAFYNCQKLTSVQIPQNITTIGGSKYYPPTWGGVTDNGGAFEGCTSLTSIQISDKITELENDVFKNCTALTSVILSNNLAKIQNGAFAECTGLTSITIPNSVSHIGERAFSNCTSLTSIQLPEYLTYIGDYVFENCHKLANLTFPSTLKDLGLCLHNCTGLKTFDIPDHLTQISLKGCSGLTSIKIPQNITSIGQLEGCTSLKEVEINSDKITELYETFINCKSLTSIKFSTGLKKIRGAFEGCTSLVSIEIPEGVTDITKGADGYVIKSAFYGCTNLQSVKLPSTVTNLNFSFEGCTSLKNIHLPENVESLECAFKGCISIENIELPQNVKDLWGTFIDCTNLKSIIIPNKASIIKNAFENCTILESVTIPNSITDIGNNTFANCINLKEIHLQQTTPPAFSGKTPFLNVDKSNCLIYVPLGTLAAYNGWAGFTNILEEGGTLSYPITYQLENITSTTSPEKIDKDQPLKAILTANNGYKLPELISVSMGGRVLTVGSEYTYDVTKGEINIMSVTSAVNITASAVKNTDPVQKFPISYNLTNITVPSAPDSVAKDTSLEIVLVADEGFTLPASIQVLADGTVLADNIYAYDKTNGKLKIPALNAAISIQAVATEFDVPVIKFPVTYNFENISISFAPDSVVQNNSLEVILLANKGYTLPDLITVTANGVVMIEDLYSYDKTTGKLKVQNVRAAIGIQAVAIKTEIPVTKYAVNYSLEHLTVDSQVDSVEVNSRLILKLIPDDDYLLPDTVKIEVNDVRLTTGKEYTYYKTTGNINIASVTGNVHIFAAGKAKEAEEDKDKPLVPSTSGSEITISDDQSFTDSEGNQGKFNGTIGSGYGETIIRKLTISGNTQLLRFNQANIGNVNQIATIVTSGTDVRFQLIGTNSLGKLVNDGSLYLAGESDAVLQNTLIENNGIFTDENSLVDKVEGIAGMTITPPVDLETTIGKIAILTASADVNINHSLLFTWEKLRNDGTWEMIQVSDPYFSSGSGRSADKVTIENKLEITDNISGTYRCKIINKVNNSVTTLTTLPATVVFQASSGNDHIEKDRYLYVQNGVLFFQLEKQCRIRIFRFNGQVVRDLLLPAGETQLNDLECGLYLIHYIGEAKTEKVSL